jgi:hypothetical protein
MDLYSIDSNNIKEQIMKMEVSNDLSFICSFIRVFYKDRLLIELRWSAIARKKA